MMIGVVDDNGPFLCCLVSANGSAPAPPHTLPSHATPIMHNNHNNNRVTSNIHLVEPMTLQRVEVSATKYWRTPLTPLMISKDLVQVSHYMCL